MTSRPGVRLNLTARAAVTGDARQELAQAIVRCRRAGHGRMVLMARSGHPWCHASAGTGSSYCQPRSMGVQFPRLEEGLYMSRELRVALWLLIIAMNVATLLMLSSL